MKIITTISIVLVFCSFSIAQNVDILSFTYSYSPKVGLMNPPNPILDTADLDVSEIKLKLLFPFKINSGKTTIVNGLEWYYVNTFFNQLPGDYNFEANLHSFQYTFGINHRYSDSWDLMIMVKPTLASNFQGSVSSDDFYMQGSAIVHKTFRNGYKIGAGASLTYRFGEPRVLPIISVQHKTEKIDLDIIAPIRVSVKYKTGNFLTGIKAEVDGSQFNLRLDEIESPFVENVDAIKFSRINIGPMFGWIVGGKDRIELSGGVSLNRVFRVVGVEDAEVDFDLDNGLFVKAGFYFGK